MAKPIPDGYHTLTPHIVVKGAKEAIDFYRRAFGAEERFRFQDPSGQVMHAELRIGDSNLMLCEECPDMGGYDDYCMPSVPSFGRALRGPPQSGGRPGGPPKEGTEGHRRGMNAKIPPQWLVYITVKSIAKSVAACLKNGGRVIVPIRDGGQGKMAVIRDPAGAVCALYEPA